MALFQKSVLNKYLKTLDDKKVKAAYQKFTDFFHNPTIIQNIREDKEEQFQYGFLQKLFDEILDYTINPNIDFNLSTEFKNLRGAKKADGAILKDGKAVGVIELKSTKTKELSKITDQAFGYKNNHPTCVYIITSNFEKLRFYINDAVDYLDFNLFTLKEEEFKLLYLCLQKDNILSNLPQKIKQDSTLQEENVTKKLYKDYSAFKNALFEDLVKNNPEHSKLTLFKKSQKLIDRFLFIFFAEDKGLLPPNSISKIVKSYEALDELDNYKPLYEVFQQYFGYINSGRPARKGKAEIFAFNGGLFAPDEMLDGLKITDNILMNHSLLLSGYDFESEVDVNILGHIFEHSLNEIDEITAELEGQTIDKSKTKRKKDGVFYTPKYITKYIVDNTVGKLCEAYKEKINLQEDDYRPNRNKATKKKLLADLEAYRAYLLELTICDPACGSGAFLNQALDFLITEHRYIDELQTRLLGGSIVLSDITNDILERNIYGVDINEESVEIARLSLWLRTAQKGRALTTLNDNIKCGNSLIDDVEVAGEKAFDWEKEFPEVFGKGGFDVVIGNPPYLRIQGLKDAYPELTHFYERSFTSSTGNYDIYALFLEKSFKFIKQNGLVSYILPHKFLISDFGIGIRKVLLKQQSIVSISHFQEHLIFKDASTYTCIITYTNEKRKFFDFRYLSPEQINNNNSFFNVEFAQLSDEPWKINNPKIHNVLEKLKKQPNLIGDYIKVFSGIQTSGDKIYIIEGGIEGDKINGYSNSLGETVKIEKDITKPLIKGDSIKRYASLDTDLFVIFPYILSNGKVEQMTESYIAQTFPLAYEYLKKHEEILRNREKGKMDKEGWFLYVYPKNLVASNLKKLVSPDITLGLNLTKDNFGFCVKNGAYGISVQENIDETNELTLLAILNSSLLWFFLKNTGNVLRGGYFRFNTKYINPFPVFSVEEHTGTFDNLVNKSMLENSNLATVCLKVQRLIQRKFNIEKLSKNLQNWHTLTFAEFVKELKKKKVKLGLAEESEWEEYFETEKAKAMEIQAVIDKTDKEIDRMVYELYGLSEEEIGIVEAA